MSASRVFPLWVFVAVAMTIALVAFAAAQFHEGAGMIVALAASGGWVAFVQNRARKSANG